MELKGQLKVTSWQEDEIRTFDDDGGRITRSTIGYEVVGDVEGEATEDLVTYFRPDGTAVFAGLRRLTGQIAGRRGSVVFEAAGGFDGTVASTRLEVVTGSGTGDLVDLGGSWSTSATREQVDYVLDVEFRA